MLGLQNVRSYFIYLPIRNSPALLQTTGISPGLSARAFWVEGRLSLLAPGHAWYVVLAGVQNEFLADGMAMITRNVDCLRRFYDRACDHECL